jgi:hypothetical protein
MATSKGKRWSQRVTEKSNALDLEQGVFAKDDPRSIARSLKRSAEPVGAVRATLFAPRCRCLRFI